MAHHKQNLPTKVCVVCERPFTWRKKWERNWEEVKYCSKHCQSKRSAIKADSATKPNTIDNNK